MNTSLIVTTYNRADALKVVLQSIARQEVLPNEVIVADDGSSDGTDAMAEGMRSGFPVPLHHVWQDDLGFRAARSRNLAIAKSTGEYLLFLDGDMMVHPRFVRDHIHAAKKKCFVQGGRVILGEESTRRILKEGACCPGPFFQTLGTGKTPCGFPLLGHHWLKKPSTNMRGIRSCNQGYWKADLVNANGFDEAFTGWGREDSELVVRLYNAGLKRIDLKFGGIAYHLHHPEQPRDDLLENDGLLAQSRDEKKDTLPAGLDRH